jgi:hypothetical protein
MDPDPDWRPEFSPADVDAHYGPNGPVASALAWVEMVLDGRLADAWPSTSAIFRLALTRHWCWRNRAALHSQGHDPLLVAAALADDGPAHPLWPAFDRSQKPPESAVRDAETRWIAAGPPEPVGPDLEVVELVPAKTAGRGHHAPPLTLLVRLSPRGWLVAGHGRSPTQPGWPPCP